MTMKTQLDLKKILPDAIAVIAFIIISFCYFMPAITEGRVLQQADIVGTVGAGEEAAEYYESHGERTRWTNGLFGGMPTYQIAPSYDSTDALKGVVKAEAYSENAARLTSLSRMRVGGREYAVEDMSAEGEFLYIKLAGVDTPEAAEALRGKELKVLRADLPAPPEGRHYIADLLGSDVIDMEKPHFLDRFYLVRFAVLGKLAYIHSLDIEDGQIRGRYFCHITENVGDSIRHCLEHGSFTVPESFP